jgi:hypothetical protein
MAKRTFVLDDDTVRLIQLLAERQQKPQSHVVREAIAVYAAQGQKLSAQERERKLQVLDQLTKRPATRTEHAVEAELQELRRSRRAGWRSGSDE